MNRCYRLSPKALSHETLVWVGVELLHPLARLRPAPIVAGAANRWPYAGRSS